MCCIHNCQPISDVLTMASRVSAGTVRVSTVVIVCLQRDCFPTHSGSEDDEPELRHIAFPQDNAMQEVSDVCAWSWS